MKVGQKIRLPDLAEYKHKREQQFEQVRNAVDEQGGTEKIITVAPGDTLSHISKRVYGKASLWKIIFQANRNQLETADDLQVGMKLKIPSKPKVKRKH